MYFSLPIYLAGKFVIHVPSKRILSQLLPKRWNIFFYFLLLCAFLSTALEESSSSVLTETHIYFGKITGKSNSVGKIIGIVLPVVFVAVVAFIALCVWHVRKKSRQHQKQELPHQSP
jgi:uncharacterized membrane protein